MNNWLVKMITFLVQSIAYSTSLTQRKRETSSLKFNNSHQLFPVITSNCRPTSMIHHLQQQFQFPTYVLQTFWRWKILFCC